MSQNISEEKVVVVGAGLGGCMTALLLARRGFHVNVIERRPDPLDLSVQKSHTSDVFGQLTDVSKRSINLALSERGLAALREVGLHESVLSAGLPMKGRMIHSPTGTTNLQRYNLSGKVIYSVSRQRLNDELLEKLRSMPNVTLIFDAQVQRVHSDGTVTFKTDTETRTLASTFLVGADGAFSAVRDNLRRMCRMDLHQFYIPHGYKELSMPPTATGDFALDPDVLHIWPRHEFMLIALPNPDKTFTCTLFSPFGGKEGLESLTSAEAVEKYFTKHFPDAVKLMPTYVEDCLKNPTSALVSVRCAPWVVHDRFVLIGDAAHAVVPFFGQGMNAAFEDGLIIHELLEKHGNDVVKALREFNETRVPDGHALTTLSMDNYVDMRHNTASPLMIVKKFIDNRLHSLLGSAWMPVYQSVTFSRMPYSQALETSRWQDNLLEKAIFSALALGAAALFARSRMAGHRV